MKQAAMFPAGEDLPLFSGTAPKGKIDPFAPKAVHKQERLPAKCKHCADTGVLGRYAFCSCEAGQAAEKHRAANPKTIRYYDEEGNEL